MNEEWKQYGVTEEQWKDWAAAMDRSIANCPYHAGELWRLEDVKNGGIYYFLCAFNADRLNPPYWFLQKASPGSKAMPITTAMVRTLWTTKQMVHCWDTDKFTRVA